MISLKFPPWPRILLIFVLIALSAGLRIWPLGALELRLAWLTFYPSVFIAALSGGRFIGGILATILSCLTVYFWSPTGEPFIVDGGDWLGIAVFFLNCTIISFISERLTSSQELAQELRIQAEKANQSKSIFLANMSHELRTPLNVILGFSELLNKNQAIPEKERKNINIINSSGEHLLHIINDVLDMSKIEAGQLKLDPRPVDLHKVFQDIIDMVRIRAEKKDLVINYEIAPEVPRHVQIDQSKMRQVYINLLGNAVKFTKVGGVTMTIKKKPGSDDVQPVLLSEIRDTGRGIEKGEIAGIFHPFEQASDAVGSREGTGLGLAITKKLIELMSGSIRIESEWGKGTAVFLEQPVELAASNSVKDILQAPKTVSGLEDGQQDWRILIVDDVFGNRQLLRQVLEGAGFNVREANNGEDAIKVFTEWHPHFIWMDRRMPVMGGLEAAKEIRKLEGGEKTVIAVLTASALKEQQDDVFETETDADISLHKPFNSKEIFACMEKYLDLKFHYEEQEGSENKQTRVTSGDSDIELTRANLVKLPTEILDGIYEAALSGDSDELMRLIQSIPDTCSGLQTPLRSLVESYRFDQLVELFNPDSHEKKNK